MITWPRPDIISKYSSIINFEEIAKIRDTNNSKLAKKHWQEFRTIMQGLPLFSMADKPEYSVQGGIISIGESCNLSSQELACLENAIKILIPWRKGPFKLFGIEIDAEWRSDFKWDRIKPHLDSLAGKKIADIGSNTGYYMFRASEFGPELVLGFETSERCWYSFELLQRFIQNSSLDTLLLGVEKILLFPQFFDVVLCMGILYHHRDPLSILKNLYKALKPGGQIIVESQCIPGEEPVALFPRDRYGKARNVYFVPTSSCLTSWVERAGFSEIEVFSIITLNPEEQRSTIYSPGESLKDFLSPTDSSKTIEGYPAPLRIALKARKV
jgi:tRNA (mo5U34)-methyltransferase